MFDNLSDKLDKALHVLKGHGQITEINVAETLKEVRRALLDADVNFKIAKEFTNTVREKALGQQVLTSLDPTHGRGICRLKPFRQSICYFNGRSSGIW
jgi:signal recognition particle subunit SRP54